jgi:hypothetical protein
MVIRPGAQRVEAKSDGGLVIFPRHGRQCNYPVFSIEATCFLSLEADVRLSERNIVCARWKPLINGTLPKFMRKCWAKFVIKDFMNLT